VSGEGVVAQRGADSGNAVGSNRSANAAAAHYNSALGVVAKNRDSNLLGIIGPRLTLDHGSGVGHFMSAGNQLCSQLFFSLLRRFIGSNCNSHLRILQLEIPQFISGHLGQSS
jgi:hypothetical protein